MQALTQAVLITGALALAAPALAQPPAATPPPAERGTAAREELETARRELAEAARKVAELSAHEADRWIRDFEVRRVVVPRVRLGVVIDADDADDGLAVDRVTADGPAAKAGLQAGDVLLAVDGRELADATSMTLSEEVLTGKEPGDVVKVRYRRGRDVREASVTLAERDDDPMMFAFGSAAAPHVFDMGAMADMPGVAALARLRALGNYEFVKVSKGLGEYFGTERGLLVVSVGERNPLTLQDGDVLLSVDGREPESAMHAVRILRSYAPGEEAAVEIMRKRRKQTLKVTMPDR